MPSRPLAKPPIARSCRCGFSLVEVVLAIGVMSFAFVGIFALLPAGLTNFRQAMDTSVGAQIAQRLTSDAQQTDFNVLIDEKNRLTTANYTFRAPKVSEPSLRYFDDQGNEIVPKTASSLSSEEKQKVLYHVNVRVMPETSLPKTNSGGDAPHVATITIQIANNPANRAIAISSSSPSDGNKADRNLFVATPGVTILTYSAHVGRNQ